MAGTPLKRARNENMAADLEAARIEIKQLKAKLGNADYRIEEPRDLNDSTRETLIREMLALADEGLSLEEIASHWNITKEMVRDWAEVDVAFGIAAHRARTRAKAATMAALRRLMEAGRGVPAAFADRMMGMHSDALSEVAGADALIRVDLTDDTLSCPHCGESLGTQETRQTTMESDGLMTSDS